MYVELPSQELCGRDVCVERMCVCKGCYRIHSPPLSNQLLLHNDAKGSSELSRALVPLEDKYL